MTNKLSPISSEISNLLMNAIDKLISTVSLYNNTLGLKTIPLETQITLLESLKQIHMAISAARKELISC